MTRPIDAKACNEAEGHLAGIAVDQLSLGEQLVIWAFRSRLSDESDLALAKGFHMAFGLASVEAALAAFKGLFDIVFHHCRRDLGFHAARCRCVSSDEFILVSLIAASHAGMAAHAKEIGRYLVHENVVQDLLDHASTLALLMQRQNLRLPLRPLVVYWDERPAVLH